MGVRWGGGVDGRGGSGGGGRWERLGEDGGVNGREGSTGGGVVDG